MVTFPGMHKDFDLAGYTATDRYIINKISNYFYITKSLKPELIGNSEYNAFIARPADDFATYVNADREIIFLLSDYRSFEIRTLEAYDAFYRHLDSARIDRSLRFLISADDGIEQKIKHYLNQNPEYPVIIPMRYSDFTSDPGNLLLAATRRNFLLRDLFGYQNALREETFFFGRQKTIAEILDLAKSGQSSSLFGLRKSGKTSAVYALIRKAKAFGINAMFVDCQDPSVHGRGYAELLTKIVQEVRKMGGNSKSLSAFSGDSYEISDQFKQHMSNALSALNGKSLIVFDEIENISPRTASSEHWRQGRDALSFWQIIRSFIQSDQKARLSVCIVGTNPQLLEVKEIDGVANPVYLFAQPRYVPSLTFDETREMVTTLGHFMGLEFDPKIISDLHHTFGGHPFFIRQVCSKVHQLYGDARPVSVSHAKLREAREAFSQQLVSYLDGILLDLGKFYPAEAALLKDFVTKSSAELKEYIEVAPEYVNHLLGYGIVKVKADDIEIAFDAIREALVKLRQPDDISEMWAEISRRRNEIESSIRTTIFHWARAIPSYEWEDVLERNLTKVRFSNLTNKLPSFLFSPKTSPLYLSDLILLLKDEAVLPFIETTERKSSLAHLQTVL
ncbi:MAG TPA: hypothetical protein PLI43_20360 [Albidovulum sp.]|uniref:AAA family ATPase n=1 Tax=Albidovulum sp. TaxID=1872424 RepID=UPI002CEFFF14|nr:hypothetical protein [Albidovulum sp.]